MPPVTLPSSQARQHTPLIQTALRAVPGGADRHVPDEVVSHEGHSNQLLEVRFADGRALMVKCARYDWQAELFETSYLAADRLRTCGDIRIPAPVRVPIGTDALPAQAYWRIDLPTLQEEWPRLPPSAQADALRSWGALVRRVHRIELRGHGSLLNALHAPVPLDEFLRRDLGERLLPAVIAEWPDGTPIVEQLLDAVPHVVSRLGGRAPTLVHNDLHMGNVLCETHGDTARCVGLLDLDAAVAGPPEADLARMQVLHGPLFDQSLPGAWFDYVREGYAAPLDEQALAFFRAFHLANLGFYSALVGDEWHAEQVAAAARHEVAAARRALRVQVSSVA